MSMQLLKIPVFSDDVLKALGRGRINDPLGWSIQLSDRCDSAVQKTDLRCRNGRLSLGRIRALFIVTVHRRDNIEISLSGGNIGVHVRGSAYETDLRVLPSLSDPTIHVISHD